jgi:small subunit ribosomal protein S8
MITDSVANMLTNIKNASKVFNLYTFSKYNKLNLNILNILISENYILNYQIFNKKFKIIKIFLKYTGFWTKNSSFKILKKISTPGKRSYCKYKNLKKNINILNFYKGIGILSTSIGLLTHHKAIQLQKGGELLCYIE